MQTTPRLESFSPLVGSFAATLILGSMPGQASLAAGEYYAHPQNAFWKIMASLFAFSVSLPYTERCQRLLTEGIAVWDVMRYCRREGSLDTAIVEDSIVANDFVTFFASYPGISRVFFNGGKAEQAFTRYVRPQLGQHALNLTFRRLPSTSPANARMPFAEKERLWHELLPGV